MVVLCGYIKDGGKLDDGEGATGLSSTSILSHVENNSSYMLAVANMVFVSGAR